MSNIDQKNTVYIATSLDGYIADQNGKLDWLEIVPNPEGNDFGYSEFIASVDAIVMGRNTYEVVLGFDIPWPYIKPVFVLSSLLQVVPEKLKDRVESLKGSPEAVIEVINGKGYSRLCIDGGKVIQDFLERDLIDELIITRIPILLGGGIPLFGSHEKRMAFEHVNTEVMLNAMVKSHYRRVRKT